MHAGPLEFVMAAAVGSRMVVRYRLAGGHAGESRGANAAQSAREKLADPSFADPPFTDALGVLRERDEASCTIETKRGLVVIAFADIALAKAVPPPPERRVRRAPSE